MKKIAIVDDDIKFLNAIVTYLKGRGFSSIGYSNLNSALKEINPSFNLAIVDINLTDGTGFDLLNHVMNKFPEIKIIIITGYDELPKRLKSFASGADDYIKKPIFPAELVARVNRLLYPKSFRKSAEKYSHLDLSREEEKLYSILKDAKGGLVSKESMRNICGSNNAVYVLLSRLKRKLSNGEEIRSVYGKGYYLKKVL